MLDLTYELPQIKTIAGAKYDWELVIGMEVHAQVSSNSKLFRLHQIRSRAKLKRGLR